MENTLVTTKNKIACISKEKLKQCIQKLQIETFCVFCGNNVVKMSKEKLIQLIDLVKDV